MREATTFVKIDRNILRWRWFQDSNTVHVFLYLILLANNEPSDFRTFTVERGQVCVSLPKIAEETGLTVKEVRTALDHLLKTGEISKKGHDPKHMIYIIEGYDRYQARGADKGQAEGMQRADKGQTNGTQRARSKEDKEWEEEKKYKKYKNGGRAYAREAPKTGAALFEEIGEELRRQEAEEAKRNDAGGNE